MTRISIKALLIAICVWHSSDGLAENATNSSMFIPSTTQATDRADITTQNGVEYKDCKITRVEPDGITVMYSKGIAKISFAELPKELQEKYHYDIKKASVVSHK